MRQNIQTRLENDTLTICLEGRIDSNNAPAVESETMAAVDKAPNAEIAIDAQELEYIASAGLRVLMSAHRTMVKKSGMKVANANEMVKELFDVTGFADILNIK